jgi:autoinducer 2 (AI-2) kinase
VPGDAILVVDAGTSAMRASLVAADGAATAVTIEPWSTFVPEDAAPFGREFDPEEVADALRRVLEAASAHRERVAAIAFTGQREGMAFVDDRGIGVFASPNIDARASAEGIAIDAVRGAEVYSATGHLPSLMQAPAKLQWLRANRPETAARVRHAVPFVDWLGSLLTGSVSMSRTLANENGLRCVGTDDAPAAMLEALDFEAELLPPVIADGAIAGAVSEGAFAGTPVVLAGADTQCALLAMGALRPGECGVAAGWSAPLQLVTASPIIDSEQRTWTGLHVVPGRWILESNALETGRAWEWICSILSISPDEAERLAAVVPACAGDALAVLGPRVMRASRLNAGIGALTLPLPLAMSAPNRGELLRSVLETAAYTLRANLEQLEAIGGARIERLGFGGGMSRSAVFSQIVADVIDRPVDVAASPETSSVGAAMLASVAVGLHTSLERAVVAMASGGRVVEPEMRASAAYEDAYSRWCWLADEFERLAVEGG